MTNPLSRSVKFARSLALATTLALPACSDADPTPSTPSAPAPEPGTAASSAPAPSAPRAESTADPKVASDTKDAGSGDGAVIDAGRISGPLPPPELPASFA